uniref:Guanylate-binding protein N-terminal domain-containing protein n=1 Tax=Chromera velia CCMP2878 TaxID=1169474 RepID=A0A0G4G9N1_9ALVE|eukprot:Cvel_4359.t1-p1 / transcript=Cvel_4359.t1 / gene=Cvel_4359 / organism=Chromera_velia_CCMP2878 / gene_product=hypothetical protein / transcript_product=hypothetical protein / location=Cvel_scaffold189:18211-23873(+) / protein_length=1139 / sequence_SO=supercontig / SO=protein_coding / is_pseudo=false
MRVRSVAQQEDRLTFSPRDTKIFQLADLFALLEQSPYASSLRERFGNLSSLTCSGIKLGGGTRPTLVVEQHVEAGLCMMRHDLTVEIDQWFREAVTSHNIHVMDSVRFESLEDVLLHTRVAEDVVRERRRAVEMARERGDMAREAKMFVEAWMDKMGFGFERSAIFSDTASLLSVREEEVTCPVCQEEFGDGEKRPFRFCSKTSRHAVCREEPRVDSPEEDTLLLQRAKRFRRQEEQRARRTEIFGDWDDAVRGLGEEHAIMQYLRLLKNHLSKLRKGVAAWYVASENSWFYVMNWDSNHLTSLLLRTSTDENEDAFTKGLHRWATASFRLHRPPSLEKFKGHIEGTNISRMLTTNFGKVTDPYRYALRACTFPLKSLLERDLAQWAVVHFGPPESREDYRRRLLSTLRQRENVPEVRLLHVEGSRRPGTMHVEWEVEKEVPATNLYHVLAVEPSKPEAERAAGDPGLPVTPKYFEPVNTICLNPSHSCEVVLVACSSNYKTVWVEKHCTERGGTETQDDPESIVQEIHVYEFNQHFTTLRASTRPQPLRLDVDRRIKQIIVGKDKCLHVIFLDGLMRTFNIANVSWNTAEPRLDLSDDRSLLLSADGHAFLDVVAQGESRPSSSYQNPPSGFTSRVHLLPDGRRLPVDPSVFSESSALPDLNSVVTTWVGPRSTLLGLRVEGAKLFLSSAQVDVQLSRDTRVLKRGGRQTQGDSANDNKLAYLHHMYSNFCVKSELATDQRPFENIQVIPKQDVEGDDLATLARSAQGLLDRLWNNPRRPPKPEFSSFKPRLELSPFPADLANGRGALARSSWGSFLRRLVCQVPLQIARTEGGLFMPLKDGANAGAGYGKNSSHALSQVLSLGLHEEMLKSCVEDWRVKVITSQGAQSTGKSYFLNHLSGSLFDISGARCTDGVWLSIRLDETTSPPTAYVLLDFEGLATIERTDQEDMLLSIFNAAITSIAVFCLDTRIDQHMVQAFKRFQNGAEQVASDESLFRGKLHMCVKDVTGDAERVYEEIGQKISTIIDANPESNFVSRLFGGDVAVTCFYPNNDDRYFEGLNEVANFILSEECASFRGMGEFLFTLKLLMAKMHMMDWTSFDHTRISVIVQGLRDQMQTAVKRGVARVADDSTGTHEPL